MKTEIKAYFFDWMGTLADATERLPMKEILTKEQRTKLLINSLKDVDLSKEDGERFQKLLSDSKYWLFEDSEEIINKLKPKYKLAIISNMYEITSQRIREIFPDFIAKFDVVTLSAEVGLKKPDIKIFTETLNKLNKTCGTNFSPSEIMMIGDKQEMDVDPSKSLGMQARIIDRQKQNLSEVLDLK